MLQPLGGARAKTKSAPSMTEGYVNAALIVTPDTDNQKTLPTEMSQDMDDISYDIIREADIEDLGSETPGEY